MKAVDSRVLVEVLKGGPTEKIGTFELPTDPSGIEKGKVISVGSKVVDVQEGDEVYMYQGAGKEFIQDGKKYRVVSLNEIIVVL
jgi:co-chaperonin GroES (HSP10)